MKPGGEDFFTFIDAASIAGWWIRLFHQNKKGQL
jgi:hypothetical protein